MLSTSALWWVVAEGGGAIFSQSNFVNNASTGAGLLSMPNKAAEVIIRSSHIVNLGISVQPNVLGIVNSTFDPPLNTSFTIAPNNAFSCGSMLAGESLCDARARCTLALGGGVRCDCDLGDGLTFKAGVVADGRQCEQSPKVDAKLEARLVTVATSKPGQSEGMVLKVVGKAEAAFNVSIVGRQRLTRRETATVLEADADALLQSSFGQRFDWVQQPTSESMLDLRSGVLFPFALGVSCKSEDIVQCPLDGDTIETTLQVQKVNDTNVLSKVVISTEVRALASCNHSTAKLVAAPGVIYTDAEQLSVEMAIIDIDGFPIRFTPPETVVLWGSSGISADRVKESENIFVALIPKALRAEEAGYKLQVVLKNAAVIGGILSGKVDQCTILETVVRVQIKSRFNTIFVLVGSCVGCVVLLAVTLFFLRKKAGHLQGILRVVFGEVSKFVLSICCDIGNLITECASARRLAISECSRVGIVGSSRMSCAKLESRAALFAFAASSPPTRSSSSVALSTTKIFAWHSSLASFSALSSAWLPS
jgi:hypothetical protein